ncbi:MAG: peroxiredoxin family protein [Aureispira sp.]
MKSILKQWWWVPILLILGWGAVQLYKTPDQKKGIEAKDFTGYLPNGDSLQLSDYRGQLVLLDFWGSWCGPCRQHNKSLVKLYKKYSQASFDNESKFHIISVAMETNKGRWLGAIEKDGLEWPAHVSDLKRLKDHVAILYGVREIPATFLIDEAGMVIAVNPEETFIDSWLAKRQTNATAM